MGFGVSGSKVRVGLRKSLGSGGSEKMQGVQRNFFKGLTTGRGGNPTP